MAVMVMVVMMMMKETGAGSSGGVRDKRRRRVSSVCERSVTGTMSLALVSDDDGALNERWWAKVATGKVLLH